MSSKNLITKIEEIRKDFFVNIEKCENIDQVNNLKIKYLGRKSDFVSILRSIKQLDPQEKKEVGKLANDLKIELENEIDSRHQEQKKILIEEKLEKEWIDVTLPTPKIQIGHKHPLSQMLELTEDIFTKLGFDVVYPREIDDEFHTFTSVNIPPEHPAKDMWDTFWTEDGHIAIPHTSAMQHRILKASKPPIRCIVPGRCFRNETTDARHEHTFYQVEGVYVDKNITVAHMLGTLKVFFSEFFGQEINVLFTPDFFPFVEPGGMMSIDCSNLSEGFKKVSKGTGWLEVLGCGMIHPNVLSLAGIDPETYSGFAWGFGLERLIMLKYDIDDVRLFESGDLRFIHQF